MALPSVEGHHKKTVHDTYYSTKQQSNIGNDCQGAALELFCNTVSCNKNIGYVINITIVPECRKRMLLVVFIAGDISKHIRQPQ